MTANIILFAAAGLALFVLYRDRSATASRNQILYKRYQDEQAAWQRICAEERERAGLGGLARKGLATLAGAVTGGAGAVLVTQVTPVYSSSC